MDTRIKYCVTAPNQIDLAVGVAYLVTLIYIKAVS